MKGINGMLAVAKNEAIDKGIRGIPTVDNDVIYGYMLKKDELHNLFKLHGFRRVETEASYIKTWLEVGYIIRIEWRGHGPVYFFVLKSTDSDQIRDLMQCKLDNELERSAESLKYVGTEVFA